MALAAFGLGFKKLIWPCRLRPDPFHLIQEAHQLSRRLESRAYRPIEVAERARRAEWEKQAPKRRQGRPMEVKTERSLAGIKEALTLYPSFLTG
jgi:hypothetical protein